MRVCIQYKVKVSKAGIMSHISKVVYRYPGLVTYSHMIYFNMVFNTDASQ